VVLGNNDVAQIGSLRARFIESAVEQVLRNSADKAFQAFTATEFRRYFSWYSDTLPEPTRSSIAERLSQLEQVTAVCQENT
jgi:hypothetical protein